MRKSLKLLLTIVLLLFFFPLAHTLITMQSVVSLPFYLLPFTSYPYIGNNMAQFLFWLSAVLLTFLFIILIIVLFYPRINNYIEKKTDTGKIAIQKKAIENFVLIAAKEEPFIVDPTVKESSPQSCVKVQPHQKHNVLRCEPNCH
ncbi:alkaline shock response membrane anchor protein AmaP, partial [Enterococcus faecium]|uniref:alkaline shock response membrane anchor protein AmaP n=1 Tax=Enterococcus faecium TaxID=1352 RepID=UPI003F4315BD